MEKSLIDRRIEQMRAEGVVFRPGRHVGKTVTVEQLQNDFDALVLAGGAEWPRDLELPPHELSGIHFAMEFLTQQNKRIAGDGEELAALDRHDQRQGQARRGHRRRRHRLRLHRHLQPAGRRLGNPARNHAGAAGAGEQGPDLAELAAQAADLVVSGRRL